MAELRGPVDDALQKLEARLVESDIPIKGASPARIEELERRYGITLPDDFRAYLLKLCPAIGNWDNDCITWWPIDCDYRPVRSIPEEFSQLTDWQPPADEQQRHDDLRPGIAAEKEKYLFFADHMDWCTAWVICCSDSPNRGRVAVMESEGSFVADSFSEFVQKVLADVTSVAYLRPAQGETGADTPEKPRNADKREFALVLAAGSIILLVCLAGLLGWLPR